MNCALDVAMLGTAIDARAIVSAAQMDLAFASPYWSDEVWLEVASESRLPVLDTEAVQAFVLRMSAQLDSSIQDFNDRTTQSVKTALVASDAGLNDLATKELTRAANCLLGYGNHKDIYVFEVLESLKLLIENGDEQAKSTLLSLAGEIEAIADYTDGDETRHARRDFYALLAKHLPQRVSGCYARLLDEKDWYYAEQLLTSYVKDRAEAGASSNALIGSLIVPDEVVAATEAATRDPSFADAVDRLLRNYRANAQAPRGRYVRYVTRAGGPRASARSGRLPTGSPAGICPELSTHRLQRPPPFGR